MPYNSDYFLLLSKGENNRISSQGCLIGKQMSAIRNIAAGLLPQKSLFYRIGRLPA